MMVLLQAMQGLGKPGVSIWGTAMGAPADFDTWFPGYAEPQGRMSHSTKAADYIPQNSDQAAAVPADRAGGHPRPAGGVGRRRLLRPVARAAVQALRVPGRGLLRDQAVLPLRRLLHRHHDRHQQVGADVPEPQAGVRRQPGRLVQQRDPHGRRHPAGLHQLRARRHRRVGRLRRLHHGTRTRATTTASSSTSRSASSRSGSPSPTTRSSPSWPRGWASTTSTPRGKTEIDWVKTFYDCSDLPKTLDWETFNKKGYYIVNAARGLQADAVPALVLRGPRLRHARHRQPQARHRQGARARHLQRQDRVRVREPQGALPGRRGAAGRPRGTSRAGRATTRPSCSRSTRCSSSRRTRGSRSTPTTTSTPTGSTTSRCTASRRTATPGGRCACNPADAEARGIKQRRHRAALQRPRLGALLRGRDRARPPGHRRTPTRRRPSTTRWSRARPTPSTGAAA